MRACTPPGARRHARHSVQPDEQRLILQVSTCRRPTLPKVIHGPTIVQVMAMGLAVTAGVASTIDQVWTGARGLRAHRCGTAREQLEDSTEVEPLVDQRVGPEAEDQ
jgi:hypothetical protein